MSQLKPQETTIQDLLVILFPRHQNKKAARTAVEFFLMRGESSQPADMTTLQRFVDFMIENGYN